MGAESHNPLPVPEDLRRFVRRILVAVATSPVDIVSDVPATGYCYVGWTPTGRWVGHVDGVTVYDTARDGPLHLSGQIKDGSVKINLSGNVRQVFVELAATAQSALFGLDGIKTVELALPLTGVIAAHVPTLPKDADDPAKLAEPIIAMLRGCAQSLYPVPAHVDQAVARFEASAGQARVAQVADDLGVSERQLSRDFHRVVGLTPKGFCRVIQINTALGELLAKGPERLAEMAAKHGFSDQAHMTRSFAQFLGRRPRTVTEGMEPMWARFVGHSQRKDDPTPGTT